MGCRGHARSRRFSTPGLVNELSRHERGLWESGKLTHHDFCEFRPRAWRAGQKRVWLRENRELVGGTPLTPFMRAALSADFANPFANSGRPRPLHQLRRDALPAPSARGRVDRPGGSQPRRHRRRRHRSGGALRPHGADRHELGLRPSPARHDSPCLERAPTPAPSDTRPSSGAGC